MSGAADLPICPCGTIANPWVVFNDPGQPTLSYRWGDYSSFRHALLQALPGETALSQLVGDQLRQIWRPTAEGDLALQMVEWWAYLADVLTFYCERIGTQAYLNTADLPESGNRLIQLLGYRPRPALGASGLVAALLDGVKPVVLPQGLQIQSKPGPGQQPQIFELDAATTIGSPDLLPLTAQPPPGPMLSGDVDAQGRPLARLTVAGTVGGLKAGDEILLIEKGWAGTNGNWGVGVLEEVALQRDPNGAATTSVTIAVTSPGSGLGQGAAAGYRLLKSNATATPFQYAATSAIADVISEGGKGPDGAIGKIALASVTRQIVAGDPVVIESPALAAANPPFAASVTGYAEAVYYANNPSDPTTPPASTPPIPIAMPISIITFATQGTLLQDPSSVVVRYGWKDLGTLIDPPVATIGGAAPSAVKLQYTPPSGFVATPGTPVLIQDAGGVGAAGSIDTANSVTIPPPVPALTAPIGALLNLLAVSRGKSVPEEILGSGDAAILGQDFPLQNSPLTYLQDAASVSGDEYSSTVKVWVNAIEWQEVRSFYGRPADAQVFLTREDEQGKTHVVFNGRLPTGVNNVVASYRYGAGAEAPPPGTLTAVLQPQPGLSSIVSPIAPTGGADADPPDKIRRLAPLSVMTFNRAVSLDDYRIIAGSAPGVARAAAGYVFDPVAQRPGVTVWVGDNQGAVAAAQSAIAAAADPNRLPIVRLATQVPMILSLTYLRFAKFQDSTVQAGLRSALLDPDVGLFGTSAVGIGQVFFASQIYAACLAVPGVQAIHDLSFAAPPQLGSFSLRRQRFPLKPIRLGPLPTCTGESYNPGPDGYFAVPAANLHLAEADAA